MLLGCTPLDGRMVMPFPCHEAHDAGSSYLASCGRLFPHIDDGAVVGDGNVGLREPWGGTNPLSPGLG